MYVIAKKRGDEFYFLSEVCFGSNKVVDAPHAVVGTFWLPQDPLNLCSDVMFFGCECDAYALLVALELLGTVTFDLRVVKVEVTGNE